MNGLIKLEDFDNFKDARDYPPNIIGIQITDAARDLDERQELEPYV